VTAEQALAIAHAFVSRRERTEQEMREHLLRRGASPETADGVLMELTELGSIDDARFARLFVQDKRDLDQWGRNRIQKGLIQRGIARDLAELTLDQELAPDGGELQRAVDLLGHRFPAPVVTARDRERALGVLLRRGYEYDLAVDALAVHGRAA
jgi:regulatory protein